MKKHNLFSSQSYFLRIITVLMIICLFSGSNIPVKGDANYEKDKTHSDLNELGARLIQQVDTEKNYRELYSDHDSFNVIDELRNGGIDEDDQYSDLPRTCNGGRFMRHFYHPYTSRGSRNGLLPPTGSIRCTDAVTWARSSIGDPETTEDRTWKGAIESYDYTDAAKLKAYWKLGHVAHLIADMAQPDHVHLEPHPSHPNPLLDSLLDPEANYEPWVEENWDPRFKQELEADIANGRLSPEKYLTMTDYLTKLARITYDFSSFYGGELSKKPGAPIDTEALFSRMFEVKYEDINDDMAVVTLAWVLYNQTNNARLGNYFGEDDPYSSSNGRSQFWETNDETGDSPVGYYYVENAVGAIPALYPNPTSFPNQVKTTGLVHLGDYYASNLLPLAVEHIAGLYQHYFDIVNHPPYVYRVTVSQNGQCLYSKYWKDRYQDEPENTITDRRELTPQCLTPGHIDSTRGEAEIVIEFGDHQRGTAEKVKDVEVAFVDKNGGSCVVDGALNASGPFTETVWSGTINPSIANTCTIGGALTIEISAKDQHNHYIANERGRNHTGDTLDSDPSIPAKVIDANNYAWNPGYKPGIDRNHKISPGQDIAFVIDITSSMRDDIDAVKSEATNIINAIFGEENGMVNSKIAIVGYRDPGQVSTILSFTEQADPDERRTAAINGIDSIRVAGGGDDPEGVYSGLLYALKGNSGTWRETAKVRRIILFGDAPPKDYELADEVKQRASNINVDLPPVPTVSGASINAVTVEIFTVAVGSDLETQAAFENIASENSGRFFTAANASDVTKAILDAVSAPPVAEFNVINGTDNDEALYGTEKADEIRGFKGNDEIHGEAGSDILMGGGDNDTIWGSTGDDTVNGGSGNDLLGGDEGNDTIIGEEGDDKLWGWTGDDTLTGGLGDDLLGGDDGDDTYIYHLHDGHDIITDLFGHSSLILGENISQDQVRIGFVPNNDADIVIDFEDVEGSITLLGQAKDWENGLTKIVFHGGIIWNHSTIQERAGISGTNDPEILHLPMIQSN